MHIENQAIDEAQIKVCLYDTADRLQWVPVGGGVFTVRKGVDHEWNPPNGEGKSAYHIKVFHAAFFDRFLCDLQDAPVNGNFVVLGGFQGHNIQAK